MKLEGSEIETYHFVSVIDSFLFRRRIAKLVCDLLVLSRLPAGLTEHLLAQQTVIWPQETFR